MKKYIFLIAMCFLCGTSAYCQKIISNQTQNGIQRLVAGVYKFELEDELLLGLDFFSDGVDKEFYIEGASENLKLHNFPDEAKLLFKTMDGSTIELTSCYTDIFKSELSRAPWAMYPITEQQLQSLFNGIAKLRVEMLSYNKKDDTIFKDFQDVEYKKDKLGKEFKKMYDLLVAERKKYDAQNANLLNKDASADF